MTTAYFSSRQSVDAVEVQFVTLTGGVTAMTLLVDSGFTGQSCFVLPEVDASIRRRGAPRSRSIGAIQGVQERAWVTCRVGALRFERTLIAIIADLSSLSLPAGIDGVAGLGFLRQFARWGAERANGGHWHFFLSDSVDE